MENNKYFIPDIEDFYVGVVYEKYSKGLQIDEFGRLIPEGIRDDEVKWRECVIKYPSDILHTSIALDKETIRVPYLAKEQIEAEGWRQELIYPNGTFIMMLGDKHKGFECMFADGDTQIVITRVWSMYDDKFLRDNIYKGNCKCINQFRLIIKLLGI